MSILRALVIAVGAGVMKRSAEEIEKFLVHGATSNIPWQQIFPKKHVPLTTHSVVEVVPAPVVGKKRIHVKLDIDMDEKSEAVTYQVQALQLAVPPPLNQAVGCLALSMAMAALWIQMWKKWNKVKPQDGKATGIEWKTDSGSDHITKRRIRGD